ncbi:hypothetical protein [Mesorhizobium sp. M0767]|uniref:hypothetical protein n=1 Tax=Mesorhizobium sp. M0767 TaxID=2956995 RepID=UPI003335A21A
MNIAPGTRVLWEEPSPHGYYHPNVLKEGRVIDDVAIRAMVPQPGYVYVTESRNAITMIKQRDCRLMHARRLVY